MVDAAGIGRQNLFQSGKLAVRQWQVELHAVFMTLRGSFEAVGAKVPSEMRCLLLPS